MEERRGKNVKIWLVSTVANYYSTMHRFVELFVSKGRLQVRLILHPWQWD